MRAVPAVARTVARKEGIGYNGTRTATVVATQGRLQMSGAGLTVSAGPRVGDLLPDFTVRTIDGRTIHRREFKGRRHLILCFAHPQARDGGCGLLAELTGVYAACRAERAELLVVLPATAGETATGPFPIVVDDEGLLRARFGAVATAALFIADRYGEIVVRHDGLDADGARPALYGLPIDTLSTVLGWLETRCSL